MFKVSVFEYLGAHLYLIPVASNFLTKNPISDQEVILHDVKQFISDKQLNGIVCIVWETNDGGIHFYSPEILRNSELKSFIHSIKWSEVNSKIRFQIP